MHYFTIGDQGILGEFGEKGPQGDKGRPGRSGTVPWRYVASGKSRKISFGRKNIKCHSHTRFEYNKTEMNDSMNC